MEERLEELRARLNATHSIETLAAALALTVALAAGAVALGVWRRPGMFAGGVLVILAVGITAGIRVYTRWLSVADVAHLADRQGQLDERLMTLVALRQRKQSSRFAAVLVAQSLALGARWEVSRLAPWHPPRSLYALVISLLLLGASNWLAPDPPPESPTQAPTQAAPAVNEEQIAALEHALAAGTSGGASANEPQPSGPGDAAASGDAGGSNGEQGAADTHSSAGQESDGRSPDGKIPGAAGKPQTLPQRIASKLENWLPQQMASSLAVNFRRDQLGVAENIAEEKTDTGTTDPRPGEKGGSLEGKDGHAKGEQAGTDSNRTGAANRSEPRADPAKNGDGTDTPKGGEGSQADSVLASTGGAMATESEPKVFKLTLGTFLQNLDAREAQQKPQHAPERGGQVPAPSVDLNQRQQQDDAMRKAEIPPEFEELVRRVYSQRPQPPQEGE